MGPGRAGTGRGRRAAGQCRRGDRGIGLHRAGRRLASGAGRPVGAGAGGGAGRPRRLAPQCRVSRPHAEAVLHLAGGASRRGLRHPGLSRAGCGAAVCVRAGGGARHPVPHRGMRPLHRREFGRALQRPGARAGDHAPPPRLPVRDDRADGRAARAGERFLYGRRGHSRSRLDPSRALSPGPAAGGARGGRANLHPYAGDEAGARREGRAGDDRARHRHGARGDRRHQRLYAAAPLVAGSARVSIRGCLRRR